MKKWKYFNDAEFIWNGNYSDPQLKYKGKIFNYYIIEDSIYNEFKDVAQEQNIEINDENFEKYCKDNQDSIRDLFEIED